MLTVTRTLRGRAAVPRSEWIRAYQAVFAMTRMRPRHMHLVLTNRAGIRKLNAAYRGKDRPTDILSFESDEPGYAGEVVLCYPQIVAQAKVYGTTIRHEAIGLFVHGMLHLLGHDHETMRDFKRMHALENKILKKLGYETL